MLSADVEPIPPARPVIGEAEIQAAVRVLQVYHQYTVRVDGDRDAAQRVLTERGVGNAVYYPTPIHRLLPYLVDGKPGPWHLPETERATARVLSLPIFPSLTSDDLERIADAANALGGAR